jgi:hypothetical protein
MNNVFVQFLHKNTKGWEIIIKSYETLLHRKIVNISLLYFYKKRTWADSLIFFVSNRIIQLIFMIKVRIPQHLPNEFLDRHILVSKIGVRLRE